MSSPLHPYRAELLSHVGFVQSLAAATLRGDAESEDVAQDVWVAVLSRPPIPPAGQRPWLVGVLRRRVADLLRRRGRRQGRERRAARPESSPSTLDHVERAEWGRRLVAAVLALDEPFRSAVLHRFYDDLPPREVALRLGVPVETVRSRVRRGLERLRETLHETQREGDRDVRATLAALSTGGAGLASGGSLVGGLLVAKKTWILAAAVVGTLGAAWLRTEIARDPARGAQAPPSEPLRARPTGEGSTEPSTPRLTGQERDGSTPPRTPPAPAPTPAVEGMVRGEDGTPIVGASVRAVPWSPQPIGERLFESGARNEGYEARTDGEGRFALHLPTTPGTGPTEVTLLVEAEGWCLPSDTSLEGARLAPDGTVRLVRGVPLEVRVLDDAAGTPLPRARVSVYRMPGYALYGWRPSTSALTDDGGLVRLRVVGGAVRVVAEAEGFASREGESLNVGPEGGSCTVRLRRGATVVATVRDPEGRLVPAAQVALLRMPATHLTGVGDASGRVEFRAVPSLSEGADARPPLSLVLLAARAPGFVRAWTAVEAPPEGGALEVTLALARPERVRGRLRWEDGGPVAGALVQAVTRLGRQDWGQAGTDHSARPARTDEAGRFELEDVAPGELALRVEGVELSSLAPERVSLAAGGLTAPLELVASRRPTTPEFEVLVRDAGGRPVRGASVHVIPERCEDPGLIYGQGRMTDGGGRARLRPAGPAPWWLFVDAPGAGPLLRRLESAEAGSEPIDVRPGPERVEGRAQRLDGSGAQVELALSQVLSLPLMGVQLVGFHGAIQTDAEGRFAFVGVHPGVTGLRCLTPGFHVVEEEARPLRVGATDLVVRVIDEAETAGLALEVEVLDAGTGLPPRGAPEVRILRAGQPGWQVAVPLPGRAGWLGSTAPLRPGPWRVEVVLDGFEVYGAEVTLAPGRDPVRVRARLRAAR